MIDANPHEIYTICRIVRLGTAVFVGSERAKVRCTLSGYPDGPTGLPLDATNAKAMARLRDRDRRIVVIGPFAEPSDSVRRSAPTLLKLMRRVFFSRSTPMPPTGWIGVHPNPTRRT